MYIFGSSQKNILSPKDLQNLFEEIPQKHLDFLKTNIEDIIDVLIKVGDLWGKDSEYQKQSLDILEKEGFSTQMNQMTLDLIPKLLSRESLTKRLNNEFGKLEILDNFSPKEGYEGLVYAKGRGSLVHISAGNIFLGCIDSLLMGFLTKNINILKLSSKNQNFPLLFAKSIKEADKKKTLAPYFSMLYWKGGDQNFDSIIKEKADTIIAWGGEEMVKSYQAGLSLKTKLLEFGPKISFQVLTYKGSQIIDDKELANNIVQDIIAWDQSACASPQLLFIEKKINTDKLLDQLASSFKDCEIQRRNIDKDEQVEILKETARGQYNQANETGKFRAGDDFLIHFEEKLMLRPSPLNRSLIIQPYKNLDQLRDMLSHFKFYLQSAAYQCHPSEEKAMRYKLASAGVKRMASIGKLMEGLDGSPHDGKYALTQLVDFISYEQEESIVHFANRVLPSVEFYKKVKFPITKLEELPLTNGDIYSEHSPHKSKLLLSRYKSGGRFFSSGGTSGKPKYTFYTKKELNTIAEMLAYGFKANGLTKDQKVANLFAAGNLWSSFLAVDQALEYIGCVQFPIGGLCPIQDLVKYLVEFKINVIFGLPSLIVDYAKYCEQKNIKINIEHIFYAGEHFHKQAMDYVKSVFGTSKFSSAGYASVDAGLIAYQDQSCKAGEHILFDDYVHLEVIDGQAIVSTKFRESMPVMRYETGDQVEITGKNRFILKGRLGDLFNLWSCKINISEIQESLVNAKIPFKEFQIRLSINDSAQEKMDLSIETHQTIDIDKLLNAIHQTCIDINKTLSKTYLEEHINIHVEKIEKVERTGKVKKLIDLRAN